MCAMCDDEDFGHYFMKRKGFFFPRFAIYYRDQRAFFPAWIAEFKYENDALNYLHELQDEITHAEKMFIDALSAKFNSEGKDAKRGL